MNLVLVHQIDGRTRLRLAGNPAAAEVTLLVDRLAGAAGIDSVDYREFTGSLVVEHPFLSASALAEALNGAGAVIVDPPVRVTAGGLTTLRHGLDSVDGLLTRATAGGLDVRTLTFAVLVGLAVRQMLRGQVMVPALSLLTWAAELLPRPVVTHDNQIGAADE